MKCKLTFVLIAILFALRISAQPAIDSTDMPAPSDILTRTVVNNLDTINYILSDSNYIWDFSMINGNTFIGDTFISVISTPFTYIATFNNPLDKEHKATVAARQPAFQSAPGVQIRDMYNFYKAAYTYYGQVGFGAEVNGIPIPVKYDHADTIYKFPLLFGNVDSSMSQYAINIPNLGYNAERKHRVNYIDGWGTLYVPGDTFEVVRVRSELQIFDSIYIDSIGFGIGFNRQETEYKWLSTESELPVFQVTVRQGGMGGGSVDGWFADHRDFSGIQETADHATLRIFPNPASDILFLNDLNSEPMNWEILDVSGRLVESGRYDPTQGINIEKLIGGVYVLKAIFGEKTVSGLFIKR